MTSASELMQRISESMQAGRSFGSVVERDGVTVIPVAYVFGGGGAGSGPAQAAVEAPPPARPPGSGGGFGVVSWPIGAYIIKNGEVKFRPVIDPFLATGIVHFLISRLTRKR